MKKTLFLIGESLKKRILSKTFIISNLVFLILSFLLFFLLPRFINKNQNEINTLKYNLIICFDREISDNRKNNIKNAIKDEFKIEINPTNIYDKNIDQNFLDNKKEIIKNTNTVLFDFKFLTNDKIKSCNLFFGNNIDEKKTFINIAKYIDSYLNNKIVNNTEISLINLGTNISDGNKKNIISFFTSIILIFIYIIPVASGNSVIVEKQNKMIEQIILNIPAKKHIIAKISSTVIFAIMQILIFISFFFIGALFSKLFTKNEIIFQKTKFLITANNFESPLIMSVFFLIFGILFLAIFFIFIASMSSTSEEYSTSISPILFTNIITLQLITFGIGTSNQTLNLVLTILSYLPPFSLILSPALYLYGTINLLECTISLLITIALSINMLYFFSPKYKNAILNYNIKMNFKEKIKYLFSKGK